jgi:hypothetical protein
MGASARAAVPAASGKAAAPKSAVRRENFADSVIGAILVFATTLI